MSNMFYNIDYDFNPMIMPFYSYADFQTNKLIKGETVYDNKNFILKFSKQNINGNSLAKSIKEFMEKIF